MTQAPLPPLNALHAFEAVPRLLNVRAAAEELGVSQSAIAQQTRLLEGHLGLRLFHRHPRGVTLTDAARACHLAVGESLGALRRGTASGADRCNHQRHAQLCRQMADPAPA
ncbi:LysR family transcriptional regulator [Aestuariivita sp.]|jgi:LysR family glycine cleavage system transcriptional activator|uniref:LysR family transcriptional regulator n=1 Tax=Aestuariivita sp. TaxID=1872407 RepID=UPI0025C35C08|nr:LysR family transcriptional regulator [Aestuariivita sp.]